ncbi:unnamed protein product (macronuclear) [Paramecium tetraurelia]|uniref:Uncharacterized protein n=1 Tax=Paramecium tetraurelia TaxID=5888 RepID=A0DU38_PARTE|nr:uncharacterized protein GSPATT00020226001 [Paramecium tetraurelia]CAK86555.1 unnamed protein product [Paramecium tetraurelia]|eukprot:XP_001453952.1 hypothetical protein (macronuclear) [Paramecium tetraurelia strain d4-2]
MGLLISKCKECCFLIRSKPSVSVSSHQLVNLSNNPAEETQGKIQAQQISFAHDHTHSNDLSSCQVDKNEEKNENDLTLETISNKQLSIVRSPSISQTVQLKEEDKFILKKQDKQTSDNTIQPQQQYQKSIENGIFVFTNIDSIKIDELTIYVQEALEKFTELVDIIDDSDTYIQNMNNIELYFSHYFVQKVMFIQIKFQFELSTEINRFLKWSNENSLFEFDLIENYKLQQVNEQMSIGEMQINKHLMIKQQFITYVKYTELLNEDYYIVYKSIRIQDQYQLKIFRKAKQCWGD